MGRVPSNGTQMTNFGKSPPKGRRGAPRIQAPLVVDLSVGLTTQSATLIEISRTGAKLSGVSDLAAGQELEFRAGTVHALVEVVWAKGTECAIAFDTPIAATEVARLRSLANVAGAPSKSP